MRSAIIRCAPLFAVHDCESTIARLLVSSRTAQEARIRMFREEQNSARLSPLSTYPLGARERPTASASATSGVLVRERGASFRSDSFDLGKESQTCVPEIPALCDLLKLTGKPGRRFAEPYVSFRCRITEGDAFRSDPELAVINARLSDTRFLFQARRPIRASNSCVTFSSFSMSC
jgi:hypothetical protein